MENEMNTTNSPYMDEEWGVDLSDIMGESVESNQTDDREADTTETAEEAADAQSELESEDSEPKESEQEEAKQDSADPDTFTFKHLRETVTLNRKQVEDLLPKGYDYDRVRVQRDELQKQADELRQYKDENAELVDFIRDLAKQSGMSAEQLMDEIRVNQYVQRNNVSQEVARERVAREKAERRLQQQEAQKAPKLTPEQEKKERMNKDIREFFQAFPNVKPDEIDKSVWDGVNQGKSLKDSYQEYLHRKQEAEKDAEIQRLRAELEAQKKNQENRAKTIGSQKAGSQEDAKDKFLEAFMSDD